MSIRPNTLLERLSAYGADIEGTMERLMDDVELYESCLNSFVVDESFEALSSALGERNYKRAFAAAHTLKGVASNLGLIPLYAPLSEIVSALREERHDNLDAQYCAMVEQLARLKALL